MKDGKKTTARKVFADTMNEIKAAGHMNPNGVLFTAIENAAPSIMVKSKRVGGSVYQVPVEVKANRKVYFACKWILDAARGKKGKPMSKRLSEELLICASGRSPSVRRI